MLVGAAPLEVDLGVAKARYMGGPPGPIAVRGAVIARRFSEMVSEDVSGSPVLFRRYRLGFVESGARRVVGPPSDRGAGRRERGRWWIAAQLVGELRCEVSWPELERKRGLVCLGLVEGKASFHDFIAWLAASGGGHFFLDYASKVYQLAAAKAGGGVAGGHRAADIVGELDIIPGRAAAAPESACSTPGPGPTRSPRSSYPRPCRRSAATSSCTRRWRERSRRAAIARPADTGRWPRRGERGVPALSGGAGWCRARAPSSTATTSART